jgi:hypothetical protein
MRHALIAPYLALLLICFQTPGAQRSGSVPQKGVVSQTCEQSPYRGIDSRLKPDIVGAIPDARTPVLGFELVGHTPVIAISGRVLGIGQEEIVNIPVPNNLKGISVDQQSNLLIQTDHGIETMGARGLGTDPALTDAIHGHLYDSGNGLFLEARSRENTVQFLARGRDGQPFLIASIEGSFSAASWNSLGLAAVVGDSLYTWEAGGRNIVRLLTDRGLRSATDVVLVGPGRAVVTLTATVLLVTPLTVLPIASMSSARCRFDGGVLYLVDGQSGLIWALKGLEGLGTKSADRAHAIALPKGVPVPLNETSPQFLEAARIIGCDQARRQVVSLETGTTEDAKGNPK